MEDQILRAISGGATTMAQISKEVEGARSSILKTCKIMAAQGKIQATQGEDATWSFAPVVVQAEAAAPASLVGTFVPPAPAEGMRRIGTRTFKGPTISDRAAIEARLGFELPTRGKAMDRNAFLYLLTGEAPRSEEFPLDRLVALFDAIFGGETACRNREVLLYRVIDCVCNPDAYEGPVEKRATGAKKAPKEPRAPKVSTRPLRLSPEVSAVAREAAARAGIEGGAEETLRGALLAFCSSLGWGDLVEKLRAEIGDAPPAA